MNIVISSSSNRTNNNFLTRNRDVLYKDENRKGKIIVSMALSLKGIGSKSI